MATRVVADEAEALQALAGIFADLGINNTCDLTQGETIANLSKALNSNSMLIQLTGLDSSSFTDANFEQPTVVYADAADSETISAAVSAGVGAYITEPPTPNNVSAALRFAHANHQARTEMAKLLRKTRVRLAERANIERAKCLLMLQSDLTESQAHATLRTLAMRACVSMGEVASSVIEELEAAESGTFSSDKTRFRGDRR